MLALFGVACLPQTDSLHDRASYDLQCGQLGRRQIARGTIEVNGCGRSAVYVGFWNHRGLNPVWLLNSPVKATAPIAGSPTAAAGSGATCGEGRDCPSGFGCRIENGWGQCRPLCRDGQGEIEFCTWQEPVLSADLP